MAIKYYQNKKRFDLEVATAEGTSVMVKPSEFVIDETGTAYPTNITKLSQVSQNAVDQSKVAYTYAPVKYAQLDPATGKLEPGVELDAGGATDLTNYEGASISLSAPISDPTETHKVLVDQYGIALMCDTLSGDPLVTATSANLLGGTTGIALNYSDVAGNLLNYVSAQASGITLDGKQGSDESKIEVNSFHINDSVTNGTFTNSIDITSTGYIHVNNDTGSNKELSMVMKTDGVGGIGPGIFFSGTWDLFDTYADFGLYPGGLVSAVCNKFLVRPAFTNSTTSSAISSTFRIEPVEYTTTDTSAQILFSTTIPAKLLHLDKSGLKVTSWFKHADNTNTSTTNIKLNGLAGTTLMEYVSAASAERFCIETTIIRTGASAQIWTGRVTSDSVNLDLNFGTAAVNTAADFTVDVVSVTPTQAGDITHVLTTIELITDPR